MSAWYNDSGMAYHTVNRVLWIPIMDSASEFPKSKGARRRLWVLAAVLPAVTVILPLAVLYWWVYPVLLAGLRPGGAANGSWVAWALLLIGGAASAGAFVVALKLSWRVIRLAWNYRRQSRKETLPEIGQIAG